MIDNHFETICSIKTTLSLHPQEKRYFAMGQLIAAGIIQSGAKFPLFSITVYEYLAGKPVADLSPEIGSIPDRNVVTFLEKVSCMYGAASIFYRL